MKRRSAQEREDTDAREQAEARRLALLAELKAREAAARPSAEIPPPEAASEDEAAIDAAPEAPPAGADPVEPA